MSTSDQTERIKFALYGCVSYMSCVRQGYMRYEDALQKAQRATSGIDSQDLKQYFFAQGFRSGTDQDIPQSVKAEMATESWQALEFFELI